MTKDRMKELAATYGKNEADTGNSAVQIAMLTERIKELTEHVKAHPKDHHTRRGLLMLVGKRKRLQTYLERVDLVGYRSLIQSLGLRR
jgi:small subunit ribosomal protein S15